MNQVSTKKMVVTGVMIAVVFVVTRFTVVTTGIGYFNMGDTAIIIAALLLGRTSGFAAGAMGSALADLSAGYAYYAPITLVVKGVEGFVMGAIGSLALNSNRRVIIKVAAILIGLLVMVGGYFIGDCYVLKFMGQKEFGYALAVKNLPSNLLQLATNFVAGFIITSMIDRPDVRRTIS